MHAENRVTLGIVIMQLLFSNRSSNGLVRTYAEKNVRQCMQIVNRTEVCVEYRKDLPIIVSVDLQPIAPLEGVVTIQVTAMINAGIALQRV